MDCRASLGIPPGALTRKGPLAMRPSDEEGFYSRKEFMRIYEVANSSFYRMVKAGQIRIYKQGRASRIAKAEAKAWAASLPTFGGGVRS